MRREILFLLSIAAGLMAASVTARAEPLVLEIRGRDVYIELGHEAGLATGSLVTLKHVIEATHPVTGEKVRDTFPLGTMTAVVVGARTSIVRAEDALFARIQVGDEVSLASTAVEHVDPWTRPAVPSNEQPATALSAVARRERALDDIADGERVRAVWQATLGRPLEERLALWNEFLAANTRSRYMRQIEQTVGELSKRIEREARATAQTPEERDAAMAVRRLGVLTRRELHGTVVEDGPTRGYDGEAMPLAFLMTSPTRLAEAWLYVREADEVSYQVLRLGKDGDGYLRGTVPSETVKSPGYEYFVEARFVGEEEPVAVFGTSEHPIPVEVDASVREDEPTGPGHSRVTLFTDYVDFDGPNSSYDQYLHAEVDFMYRFFHPIYSLRLGFGTLSGHGGPKDVIDLGEGCTLGGEYRCRRVGYNYAFTEIEKRMTELFAVMLRVQWGSAFQDQEPMEGVDREFFDAFGVRGRIRLGREDASNLVLGATTTERLGVMFEGAFTWDVIPKFPVVLAVQVTDQPVLEDMGVRLISDIGWRHFDWVYPSLRIAYQARDIDHAGLSAGLAANFDW